MAQAVGRQSGIEQLLELFPGQVAVVYRHFLNLMPGKRVALKYVLLQSQPRHLVQQDQIVIVGGNFQPQYG